jgi:hypothetical protein
MAKDEIPISVVALRADNYRHEDKTLIISLTTKYSAIERKYLVPLECLYDFIVDLQRLDVFSNIASFNNANRTVAGANADNALVGKPRVRRLLTDSD